MEQQRIPKRSELDPRDTWATEDLFASDGLWQQEYEALRPLPARLSAYAGHLGDSAQSLLAYLRESDALSLRLERLYQYAQLCGDADTGESRYQNMRGQAMGLLVAFDSAASFETPELLAIPDERLDGFFAEEPALGVYRRKLHRIRRMREHILSAAEERLLAAAGEMASAPDNIGATFRNADLRFPPVVDSAGNARPLTQGSYLPLMEDSDRAVRRAAFEQLYATFGSFRNTAAALLDGQFKQLLFYARARGYDTTLDAALDSTEVPTAVYHSLIDAVHGGLPLMHRYVALRKKLLALPELHYYDLYVPIAPADDGGIPYAQAQQTVLEALAVLGDDYGALLREGFSGRWIDVYENEGKRSGAYSSGGRPHPYVLLNHKDTLDGMFTLAHEMGHALHSYLSNKHQPQPNADYVIFVAEVASTCNEVLLMEHLLGKTTDKRARAALLNHFLEQFRGTLFRQTMFAEFELFLGLLAEGGESLTADALSEEYARLCAAYHGPDICPDGQIAVEWARIPHFFFNYYVFQYSTGFAAAIAIARAILREGQPAVERYLRFLSSGGSDDPISLLRLAGVDMTSPAPVQDALSLFSELLDEMEALLSEDGAQ